MNIIENKILHLTVRNPERITTVIPKSKQISEHEVIVYWTLEAAQVLRNLGVKKVPSPIRAHYQWPAHVTPFAHQITTAEFLSMTRRGFCFNAMGTGKSASAIWAADYLMQIGLIKRALVLCPLSIMESAWGGDLFRFAMHRSYTVAHGTKTKRLEALNSASDFVVMNYEGAKILARDIHKSDIDLVIIDEASAIKTATTARWKAINSFIKPTTWIWAMTGTPAAQSPLDAYGLAKMVTPENVPPFFGKWRDLVMFKVTQFKWAPKEDCKTIVHQVLQPAIRFTKEECLDLPELTYIRREIDMTPQQKKHYEQLRDQMIMSAAGETVTTVNAAVNMNKLLQIALGMVYSDSGETLLFDISTRYNVLKEVLEECSNKILIFAPFRHTIEELRKLLVADGYDTDVIHGGVGVSERTRIFSAFQNTGKPRILVIQPQAAAHGLTLHAADTTIWWGPITSFEVYAQANARMHRAGQTKPCVVVQLSGSPVERKIYKMLDSRKISQDSLLDLYKELLS